MRSRKYVTALLALLCLISAAACPTMAVSTETDPTEAVLTESGFPDVDEDAPYAEAVSYISEIGIMEGDENRNFNPDRLVTRAEMAAIICRMLGETEGLSAADDFLDVPRSHWANPYVSKATELGVINGYPDGRFGPSDNVTYEQAVTMVVRAVGYAEAAQDVGGYPDGFLSIARSNGYLENVEGQQGVPLTRASITLLLFNYYNNNI